MVEDIEARLREELRAAEVTVDGAGNRFEIDVVSDEFAGLSRVKRQQLVYPIVAGFSRSKASRTIKSSRYAELSMAIARFPPAQP